MNIFKNIQEIILINKNLFLLTGKLDNDSNGNVKCGSSSRDFLGIWFPGSPLKFRPE